MTHVLAVEPLLPQHRYSQSKLTDALVSLIGLDSVAERLMRRIHAGCEVDYRHTALPLEHYSELTNFEEHNDAFIAAAVELGAAALTGALKRSGLAASEIDVIISTTVTGLAVPSLEARIAERVGLRPDVIRIPLMGLGCMGGAAGIARLDDFLRGRPAGVAALLSVELCSLTVQRGDSSGANLVASGLFGDGAGAVVAVGEAHPKAQRDSATAGETSTAKVIASASKLYPGTTAVMGWDVRSTGLHVVLGPEVPDLVDQNVGRDVTTFLNQHGLGTADIGWWVCHPGGPKVIDALISALAVPREALAITSQSLREVGNLSSASVLHILQTTLDQRPEPGSHGLMMAMGPGFSLELVLLKAQ